MRDRGTRAPHVPHGLNGALGVPAGGGGHDRQRGQARPRPRRRNVVPDRDVPGESVPRRRRRGAVRRRHGGSGEETEHRSAAREASREPCGTDERGRTETTVAGRRTMISSPEPVTGTTIGTGCVTK